MFDPWKQRPLRPSRMVGLVEAMRLAKLLEQRTLRWTRPMDAP
jgi:hypothetical protein